MTCDYCEPIEDGIFDDRCGDTEDYELVIDAPEEYSGDIDSPFIFHICKNHWHLKHQVTWGMVIATNEQLLNYENEHKANKLSIR